MLIKELTDYKDRFMQVTTSLEEKKPNYNHNNLSSVILSSLGSRVISYLPPADIMNLEMANKEFRIYISKSYSCQLELCKNIAAVKNRKIGYFHKHIKYFEEMC